MRASLNYLVGRMKRKLVHRVCRRMYRDDDRDVRRCVVVAGTARSGTTWLADIIQSQGPCRLMFEPFHFGKVSIDEHLHYFHYMRSDGHNEALRAYSHDVLTGNIRHPWIDLQIGHIFPKYRLIKEIRACLFLRWLHEMFPVVPLLFIIRHPCAVVASRMRLNYATDSDIEPFLAQPELIEDFLADKLDFIKGASTPEEKHAIIWCVNNLVPLRQFHNAPLNLVFYENLCLKPEQQVPRIFRAIGREHRDSVFRGMSRASMTSRYESAVVQRRDRITDWKRHLNERQIDNVREVVRRFGLDHLYGGSDEPTDGAADETGMHSAALRR